MTLTPEQLAALPEGATYEAKDGNATGMVKKTDKGIEFTANCDSLSFLIEELKTEVYRFQSENLALVTKTNRLETKGLTGWQEIQIKGFRILLPLTIILLIIILRKYKPWQKLKKILKKLL